MRDSTSNPRGLHATHRGDATTPTDTSGLESIGSILRRYVLDLMERAGAPEPNSEQLELFERT